MVIPADFRTSSTPAHRCRTAAERNEIRKQDKNSKSNTVDGKVVGHRSVSLKELAAHLDLSLTTVSRVMNHSAAEFRIAAATQQRVLEAASALKYVPNAFARGLRKKRSFTVGVMVPEISEGYAAAVLSGIGDALLQEKLFYFVVSHRHREELLDGYPRLLLSRAVEGIIAVDTPLHDSLPVPIVAVSGRHRRGILTIELDHLTAARYAISHLAELGHRKIAFIKGQTFSSDTTVRWEAIRKVCVSLNIRVNPELVVQLEGMDPGSEPGYVATKKLLTRKERFTAIFAFNDASAIGAITALHEAGLHVPRKISVVGFDDIPTAATIRPALTTVRQPLYEMGQMAAMNLMRLIPRRGNSDPLPDSILVSPTFVRRHSTDKAVSD